MCLEDIAIGFGSFASEKVVTLTTSSGLIVAANPNRSFLIISHPVGNPIHVSTINPADTTFGLHLGTADQPLFLDVKTYGNLCAKAWYGIAVGGNATLSVWEGEFDIRQARDFIRQFKQQ